MATRQHPKPNSLNCAEQEEELLRNVYAEVYGSIRPTILPDTAKPTLILPVLKPKAFNRYVSIAHHLHPPSWPSDWTTETIGASKGAWPMYADKTFHQTRRGSVE